MASSDILRYIDSIARDRDIDPDQLLSAVEYAIAQALAKKYGIEDLVLSFDRESGEVQSNYEIDLEQEGRIVANAVKQSFSGSVREAERDRFYDEYEQKLGEIVNGLIRRTEGEAVYIELARNLEGILPRAERVRGENYSVGDRIRAMVFEVKKAGSRVKVILSRAHKDFVRALFELEVPEIADGVITIRQIEREPGYRTKIAVDSADEKVDCVGACVGVRGTRIKSIIDELNGERIDIIRWVNDPEQMIVNALKPAEISHIELDDANREALVLVDETQLSLAIGRRGQNVRLASKLTKWDINIMTRSELEQSIATEGSEAAGGESAAAAAGDEAASEAGGEDLPPADAGGEVAEAGEEPQSSDSTDGTAPEAAEAAEAAPAEEAPANEAEGSETDGSAAETSSGTAEEATGTASDAADAPRNES